MFATVCSTAAFVLTSLIGAADAATLADSLEQLRKDRKIVGAVIGVYRPGKEPIELALGQADADSGRPTTLDCAFRIGSISKVFVGTVVLQLAGEGKLSVDEPISRYVSGVPGGDSITVRHLANHRSGLFNHIESREVKDAFSREPARQWTLDELLAFSFKNRRYFEPGAAHHYSNANTVLLAMVVDKVTGNSWRSEVQKRILTPLQMNDTVIPVDNTMPRPYAEGYAFGTNEGPFFHRGELRIRVTETSPSWWGPAGSIISTLGDLRKAAKPLAMGELLTPAMQKELHRWTTADQKGYEYGFHIEKARGLIGHDGDVPGYQSVMYYSPKHDATIVALSNVYGWSLRDMPASRLVWSAAEQLQLVEPAK